jgi:tripartite-type tricarboxylate transporter receptor subunit TctC
VRTLLLALLSLFIGTANAAYPERPITILVAYSAGGGTDLVARAIAPYIEKYLGGGAKMVIVNRAGAGGEIGFAALSSAPADGYTIGFINTPPLMSIPIERKAQFQALGFDLLGNIVDDPSNFAVHAESEIRDLKQLAAFAKANPGRVTVGTTGIGSDDHLAMLLFERIAGVQMTHIPFKGSADVRTALASRQITVAAINVGEALQAIRGGLAMRNIGQFSPGRSMMAQDLPTGIEQGFNFTMSSLRGMAAPRGLPADVRERLVKAVAQAAADPEFQAQALKVFAPLRYLSPSQFETEIRAGDAQLRKMWSELPWGENK